MVCPYCQNSTKVTNSRYQKRNNQTWRRRQCLKCSAIFTTHEQIDLSGALMVMSPNNQIMPFLKERLYSSVLKACEGLHDPYGTATELTSTIINQVRTQAANAAELTPDIIAATAGQTLERFNKLVYLRYAAAHAKWFDLDITAKPIEPKTKS